MTNKPLITPDMTNRGIDNALNRYFNELRVYDSQFWSVRKKHTRKNFYAGLADAKRLAEESEDIETIEESEDAVILDESAEPMTKDSLRLKYGSYVHASFKHRGAGKEKKEYFDWEWRDIAGHMRELRELYPRDYAFFLMNMERKDFTDDRYWDVPDYRDEAIKSYRNRIKAIRLQYGLSQSDVAEFMRVG